MEPVRLGDLLSLKTGNVNVEVPHLVPSSPDCLLDDSNIGVTGGIEDNIATRQAQRGEMCGRQMSELGRRLH